LPRIDRELRVALAAVVLLSIAAGAAAWWALREPPTPVIDRTPLEDPPEVKRELARQLAARRKKQPGPARPEPRPAARKTITLRPLPQAARVQSLAEARKLPPASFDLAYTALLVARLANPQLDLERQLKQLDELAQAILLTLLTEMLRGFGEYRLWIYTLTLMLILFFLPNGLVAPLWRRMTERFR